MINGPTYCTEVFAFSAPQSKAGDLLVDVSLGAGVKGTLHASRTVWLNLYRHLAAAFPHEPLLPAPKADKRHRRRGRRELSPEIRGAYINAALHFSSGEYPSRRACAAKHGLPYNAWNSWCYKNAAKLERMLHPELKPILKPGGKLL